MNNHPKPRKFLSILNDRNYHHFIGAILQYYTFFTAPPLEMCGWNPSCTADFSEFILRKVRRRLAETHELCPSANPQQSSAGRQHSLLRFREIHQIFLPRAVNFVSKVQSMRYKLFIQISRYIYREYFQTIILPNLSRKIRD